MLESQHTEFKLVWRDDYLRWICGFANAEGGLLIIGRDNQGAAVGVANAAKLLEDLPNKIRDVLGILVDVNLLEADGKQLIETSARIEILFSDKAKSHRVREFIGDK